MIINSYNIKKYISNNNEKDYMIYIMFRNFRLIPAKTSLLSCGVYSGILKYSTISTKSTPKKYKLPNVSEFARKLSDNDLNNLKFDLNSDSWYILENNIWTRISSNKAYKLVWNILENHEETRGNFTPDYHKKLCLSLTWCSGVEFCSRQH